ncbi:MAG: hypothetical protein ABIK49_02695, partial [candidate division WOR-3 bacterium]
MEKKPIRFTDTTLRDGHQSLWATRMTLGDMLPVLEQIDSVGYWSLEMWGGATFDVCLRFLNEDPWERLSAIRERVKRTRLQMLLRGQNVVGYRNYPDDVLEEFVNRAAERGIDIFRIFDALNDARNLEKAVEFVKKAGKHAQGTLCYAISPVHTSLWDLTWTIIILFWATILLKRAPPLPTGAYAIAYWMLWGLFGAGVYLLSRHSQLEVD